MNPALAVFLDQYQIFGGWQEEWNGVPLDFRVYLGNQLPPKEYIASVRAIVIREQVVLVVHSTVPILSVGGRCEPNETLEEGLKREVLEESGCLVKLVDLIGFIHVQHLDEQRPAWGRPAPDFIDLMFVVEFQDFDITQKHPEEPHSEFIPISQVEALGIHEINQTFLKEALFLLGRSRKKNSL